LLRDFGGNQVLQGVASASLSGMGKDISAL
jgi:hypothetical protein